MSSTVSSTVGALAHAGQELSWIAARVALYPAGFVTDHSIAHDPRHRLDTLSPVSRGRIVEDIAARGSASRGTPVVLVHGVVDNRSAFAVLGRALRKRGFGRVTTVSYPPLTSDVTRAAERLGRHIERICDESDYDRVLVVGHSLGGIIARYYVQRQGGDARVDTLVTLGSPHAGTRMAHLLPLPVIRQLAPGSALMRELAGPARCRTRIVSIWSDGDEIVLPRRNGALSHPDLDCHEVRLRGVGHIALLADRGAVAAVVQALTGRTGTVRNTGTGRNAGTGRNTGTVRLDAESQFIA